jgi:ATP-dependent Lhr-like helicase
MREHAANWSIASHDSQSLGSEAVAVREALAKRGASFFHEIVSATGLLPALVERALAELAGAGIATADSFAGLRALLAQREKRRKLVEAAGRWSLLATSVAPAEAAAERNVEPIARALLKRYGVVFRSMLVRETQLPPWRDLVRVYRRLEARGEIRGGRFVSGFGGEQFAASDAVGRLRAIRKQERIGELVTVSATDPLNLVGILTPEARVPAVHTNHVLLRDGLPIAALEGGEVRRLAESDLTDEQLRGLLARRSRRVAASLHPRTMTGREAKALANRTVH